jgi:hypothetical protein
MNDELESQFNRVNISSKDFEEAHMYLVELRADLPMVLQRALLTAAVVAYARPFKNSRGSREGSASARLPIDVGTLLGVEEIALHERIIDLRDRGVAHSDFSMKPTRRVARQDAAIMAWSKPFDVLSELIDVQAFRDLVWSMHCHCVNAIFVLGKQLRDQSTTAPLDARAVLPDGAISLRIPLSAFAPLSLPARSVTDSRGSSAGENDPTVHD